LIPISWSLKRHPTSSAEVWAELLLCAGSDNARVTIHINEGQMLQLPQVAKLLEAIDP